MTCRVQEVQANRWQGPALYRKLELFSSKNEKFGTALLYFLWTVYLPTKIRLQQKQTAVRNNPRHRSFPIPKLPPGRPIRHIFCLKRETNITLHISSKRRRRQSRLRLTALLRQTTIIN